MTGENAIGIVVARETADFASPMRDVPTSIRRGENRSNCNSNFKIVPVKRTRAGQASARATARPEAWSVRWAYPFSREIADNLFLRKKAKE